MERTKPRIQDRVSENICACESVVLSVWMGIVCASLDYRKDVDHVEDERVDVGDGIVDSGVGGLLPGWR